jgi:hypothetical protein
VTLYLPPGAKLVKSRIRAGVTYPGVPRPGYWDLHYRMVADTKGIKRPQWFYHHLLQGPPAAWYFTIAVSYGTTKACLGALGVAVGVRGAPVQEARGCFAQKG